MAITLFHVCHEYVMKMSWKCHEYVINMSWICHEYVINLMGLISLTNQSNIWMDTKFLEKQISFPILHLLQESFSSLTGTSIGCQKIQPFLPQSNCRIKKGETEEKASYFLLSARKSSLLRKITRNVLSLHEHVLVIFNNFPPFPPNPVSSRLSGLT